MNARTYARFQKWALRILLTGYALYLILFTDPDAVTWFAIGLLAGMLLADFQDWLFLRRVRTKYGLVPTYRDPDDDGGKARNAELESVLTELEASVSLGLAAGGGDGWNALDPWSANLIRNALTEAYEALNPEEDEDE